MKKILILTASILTLILFSCQSNSSNESKTTTTDTSSTATTSIEFKERFYDFGTVTEGEKVSHTFKFANTGNADLILNNVKASCGCTASNYTKDPVKPGDSGIIEVIFNSAGRPGPNHKSLTVIANTEPKTTVLTFSVKVEKSKTETTTEVNQ